MQKIDISRRSLLGAVAGGVTLAAGASVITMTDAQAVEAKQPLKIGLLASLTGSAATAGARVVAGAEIARDMINEAGGVAGQQISFIIEDTESNPKAAMDAVHKLVDIDKVPVVLGEHSSAVTMATGAYTNSKGVVQINVAATAVGLRKIGPNMFSMLPTDEFTAMALAKLALEDSGGKRVSIITTNDSFGMSASEEIKTQLEKLGGQVVALVPIEPKRTDYRAELQRVFAPSPDAVISIVFFETARAVHLQAYEMGFYEQLKGHWYAAYINLASEPSIPETVEGLKGIINQGASSEDFTRIYREKLKDPQATPSVYALLAYDAVWVTALATAMAGQFTADAIRPFIPVAASIYRGLSSDNKTLDADGIPISQSFAFKISQSGKLVDYVGSKG
ncbi:ABC transporter substrate-binding protein [Pseudochrobactrum sp. MP213Fo]|uniref:ABC transporter substrate-binding protein n=1 Tax=Pseudochrobactrum sp. MP213Fo TaxID=3022250 RepID=UPI003B9E9179